MSSYNKHNLITASARRVNTISLCLYSWGYCSMGRWSELPRCVPEWHDQPRESSDSPGTSSTLLRNRSFQVQKGLGLMYTFHGSLNCLVWVGFTRKIPKQRKKFVSQCFRPSYIRNLAKRKPDLIRLPRLLFSGLTALRKNRKKSTLLTDK